MYGPYAVQIVASIGITGILVGAGAMRLYDKQTHQSPPDSHRSSFWLIVLSSSITAFVVANIVHWYHMYWLLIINQRFGMM